METGRNGYLEIGYLEIGKKVRFKLTRRILESKTFDIRRKKNKECFIEKRCTVIVHFFLSNDQENCSIHYAFLIIDDKTLLFLLY